MSTSGSEVGENEEEAQWLFFEVADTGIGIGPKGLKSLFREYVQVASAYHKAVGLSCGHRVQRSSGFLLTREIPRAVKFSDCTSCQQWELSRPAFVAVPLLHTSCKQYLSEMV